MFEIGAINSERKRHPVSRTVRGYPDTYIVMVGQRGGQSHKSCSVCSILKRSEK